MPNDPTNADRRRAGLRQLLAAKTITCSELAREIGLPNGNILFNFLNGRSASLSLETIERILTAHPDVSFHDLVGLRPPGQSRHRPAPADLMVTIELRAGLWRTQIHLPAVEWRTAPFLPPRGTTSDELFAARVSYPGAERLYPEGSVLLCRHLATGSPMQPEGAHVVTVKRWRAKMELTVRELRHADGEAWLWPCSTNPRLQQPSRPSAAWSDLSQSSANASAVVLLGVVIASWQPAPAIPAT